MGITYHLFLYIFLNFELFIFYCKTFCKYILQDKFPRFHKKDVSKSMEYTLEAYDGHAESLNDLNSDQLIDTIKFERWFLKDGVKIERASVSKQGFLGTLFIPEGEGPHPG